MEIELNNEFILTDEDTSSEFSMIYNFSFVTIEKIILKSHLNQDSSVWVDILGNTTLKVIQKMNSGVTRSYSLNLLQFVTANHKFPMLELHMEIPSKTDRQFSSMSDYTTNVEFKLDFAKKIKSVEFLFLYKTTPGAGIDGKI